MIKKRACVHSCTIIGPAQNEGEALRGWYLQLRLVNFGEEALDAPLLKQPLITFTDAYVNRMVVHL